MTRYFGTLKEAFAFGAAAVLLTFAAGEIVRGQSATATRELRIKTEPNAAVWLNGVLYGRTNGEGILQIRNAPAGKQIVKVRADGFKESNKALLPAQKGTIEIVLVKTTDEGELAFQEAERLSAIDREKATAAYRTAIRLKPASVDAHVGLARMLIETGDVEGANKAIRQALKLNPRHAEAAAVDGRLQKQIGDDAKAIAAFKKAITNGGGFQPEAYTGLGMLYQERAEAAGSEGDVAGELKNYADSEKNFAAAVKQLGTSPDAPVVMQLLGLVYEKQQKSKEAIALYENFLRLFPESPEASAVQSFIVQLKKLLADQ